MNSLRILIKVAILAAILGTITYSGGQIFAD